MGAFTDHFGHQKPSSEFDSSPDELSDEDVFEAFVGPNAEKFLEIYRARNSKGSAKRGLSQINWAVFLAGIPWFFYRKLYIYGVAIMMIPVLAVLIFPGLADVSLTGAAIALAVTANDLYVWHVDKQVTKLNALDIPAEERLAQARKRGGTSKVGAAFGALIVISSISFGVVASTMAALPNCQSPEVQSMVHNLMEKKLVNDGADPTDLNVSEFTSIDQDKGSERHLCEFSVIYQDQTQHMFALITWHDQSVGEYRVQASADRSDLVK